MAIDQTLTPRQVGDEADRHVGENLLAGKPGQGVAVKKEENGQGHRDQRDPGQRPDVSGLRVALQAVGLGPPRASISIHSTSPTMPNSHNSSEMAVSPMLYRPTRVSKVEGLLTLGQLLPMP